MGPRSRQLTDSQKELAAVIVDELEGKTPPVGTYARASDSSDTYDIAERVVRREEAAHMRHCVKDGPVCDVLKRIDDMEESVREVNASIRRHDDFISQYLGEQKFKRFVMPVLIGFVGSAAGVGLIALVFRGLVAGIAKAIP